MISREAKRKYDREYRRKNRERLLEYDRRRWADERGQAQNARRRSARAANPRRFSAAARKSMYGVDAYRYAAMWAERNGLCRGCALPLDEANKGVTVDHDHRCCPGQKSCGRCVRGLLCNGCNIGAGRLGENPATLRRLADYLESFALPPNEQPGLF